MLRGEEKTSSKLAENQPSIFIFPANNPFSAFSLHRGLQPPPPSSPGFSPSSPPPVAIKPSHVIVAPLLSLLCKNLLLCHRDSSSGGDSRGSGHHLASKLSSFPKAAGIAALSSATPTAPAVSFPSPLQDSAPSSSSRDQCTLSASPPPVAPCTTIQATNSLHAR